MITDSPKTIFRSARHFLNGTLISRFTGLLRDIAIAFSFGTTSAIAAFLVAFRFAHLLRRLLGEGAMQTAFIPHFEELRNRCPKRACQFFSNLYCSIILLLAALIPCSMFFLLWLYNTSIMSPGSQEIIILTLIMLPSLLFICLYGLNASLLQCEKKYFIPSFAPAMFNVVWIIGVLLLRNYSPAQAMPKLSLFIIAAAFTQWMITVPFTFGVLKEHGQLKPWENIHLRDPDLIALGRPLLLGIFGIAATQINSFLDALFARYASLDGPAYLWYSIRAAQLPLSLFGVAIAGALLPPLSRAIKAKDYLNFRRFFDAALRRTLAIMIPISCGIFVIGDSAVNLIYGRGSFTIASTATTSICFWAYSFGLVPMAVVLLLAPAFYSRKNYRIPTIGSLASLIVNVLLNSIMVFGLGFGAVSIALATSISAWINCGYLFYELQKEVEGISINRYLSKGFLLLLASLVGCLAVFTVETFLFGGSTAASLFHGKIPSYSREFPTQALRFFTEAATYLGTVYAGAWIFHATDFLRLGQTRD